jgi:hypothetical protein
MIIIKQKEENDEIKNREKKKIYIYICTIAQERGKIY